jgi:hypothetical protein
MQRAEGAGSGSISRSFEVRHGKTKIRMEKERKRKQ